MGIAGAPQSGLVAIAFRRAIDLIERHRAGDTEANGSLPTTRVSNRRGDGQSQGATALIPILLGVDPHIIGVNPYAFDKG